MVIYTEETVMTESFSG